MRIRLAPALAILLTVVGALRIVSTYPHFSQFWDEGWHLACGMEWWTSGTTNCDPAHPPLARLAIAAPLYWKGLRSAGAANEIAEGNRLLHSNGEYQRNLSLARAGTLPFYFLGSLVVYLLGRKLFGEATAVVAVGLFSSTPMILQAGSIAYTDMALVACFSVFVYRWVWWLESPTLRNSIWLGVAAGVAVGAKYSAVPYLLILMVASVPVWWRAHPELGIRAVAQAAIGKTKLVLVSTAVGLFTLWAIFHFSTAPISSLKGSHPTLDQVTQPGTALNAFLHKAVETPLPLARFGAGLAAVAHFNNSYGTQGDAYLFLGKIRTEGVWYFFPVVLLCSFPLVFVLSWLGGLLAAARGRLGPWTIGHSILVVTPACILLVNMLANLSYSSLHVAGVIPFLAILGAAFVVTLWNSSRGGWLGRAVAAGLLAAHLIPSAMAHPRYHNYSNVLRMLLPPGSSFDSGQDVGQLAGELARRGVPALSVSLEGSNDLSKMGLPPHAGLAPYRHTTGWIAISEKRLKMHAVHGPPFDGFAWLENYQPVARIGASIRLYYIAADP